MDAKPPTKTTGREMLAKLTPTGESLDMDGDAGSGPVVTEEWPSAAAIARRRALTSQLMEQVVEPDNLNQAYARVLANKGSPGVDGMGDDQLADWVRRHKQAFIASLLGGSYEPQPVRGVNIPKPGGGERQLGIPTVTDRLVQQAFLQVLTPILDPTFSPSSYGFRPGKRAQDALAAAKGHVAEGHTTVVDIDLEKFVAGQSPIPAPFDRVNHDVLMNRLGRHVGDKRMLRIIGRFLRAGLMQNGVCMEREEGTPQGGPLSPLLANLMLDDLDKELEKRGHRFCRYADDCDIYVQSIKAGERVMASVTTLLEDKLHLRVNRLKSAVAHVSERKFLGHRLLSGGRLGIAPQSLKRARERL